MKLLKVFSFVTLTGLLFMAAIYWSINYASTPSISALTEIIEQKEATLFNQVIPDTDLPPEGTRSLFDHLITQNEGIPFPFSEFSNLLTNVSPNNEPPLSVLIPNGRSLLKGQADNTLPRIILSPDFQAPNTPTGLGLNTQGQLFMGFVEAADEIEVISYNEAAGRFEYQLVQNYCEGCVPRVVYARRAICLTCHQGGTQHDFSSYEKLMKSIDLKNPGKSHLLGMVESGSMPPYPMPLVDPEMRKALREWIEMGAPK